MDRGFVYILKSLKNGKFYIGSTGGISKRIKQHQRGHVKATCNILPIKLEFFQEYESVNLARKVEYRLKKLKRKDYIVRIIESRKIKMGQ